MPRRLTSSTLRCGDPARWCPGPTSFSTARRHSTSPHLQRSNDKVRDTTTVVPLPNITMRHTTASPLAMWGPRWCHMV